jgi:hypothetical protein
MAPTWTLTIRGMDRLRSLLVIYQASIWTAADVHTLLTVEHLGGRLIGVKLKVYYARHAENAFAQLTA